jgi:hypothetical protein
MRICHSSLVALLVGTCFTTDALGQEGVSAPPAVPARNVCFDSIPASSFRLVPVYLTATLVDSSGSYIALRQGVDSLTQSVAQSVRALDAVRMRHDSLVFPDTLAVDSIRWVLGLESASFREGEEPEAPKMRLGIPVFSVLKPWEQQVQGERVHVRYPEDMRRAGFMGTILMELVVDTAGHPVPSTVRDLLPPVQPPLNEKERFAYERFVRSIRLALETARYEPAKIGGCALPQMVHQPFGFALDVGRPKR